MLRQEEAAQAAQAAGAVTDPPDPPTGEPVDTIREYDGETAATTPAAVNIKTLDGILASALNEELRQVYLRAMGYTHWLDRPSKEGLVGYVTARGYSEPIVRAACAILSQPALGFITDSGNHYLATNEEILGQAAERIMPEILEALETWE